MEKLKAITSKIHLKFSETSFERAKYLKSLIRNPKPIERYLDIGTGLCTNALVFGEMAKQTVALDVKFSKRQHDSRLTKVIASATYLPFRESSFDTISLFSVIEHVPYQKETISEALISLKNNGNLLIQIPNINFPIELHTGIPFIFYLPKRVRNRILKTLGYEWMNSVNIPTLNQLLKLLSGVNPTFTAQIQKVIYPPEIIVHSLRSITKALRKLRMFNIIPFGYFLIIQKG